MKYFSTRNKEEIVTSAEAIVTGLSPDGGLFVPDSIPTPDTTGWEKLTYPELAGEVLPYLLPDFDKEFLKNAAEEVYGKAFAGKAGYTTKIKDNMYALELWHGPTCAFKDYALQYMPRMLVEAKKILGRTETTRFLVATSGDTGKAALEGYKDLDGIEIRVFFPDDGTSEIQRLQMATQRGSNVGVYAVEGTFDVCQRGIKTAFNDKEIAAQLKERNIALSSANSINWGRLVPQVVYYFYSYYRLVEGENLPVGTVVDFCVPSGNFGDVLAGYYAKQMGLPIGKFIVAVNDNNSLSDFINTGVFDSTRTFHKTSSPSMDVLVPSNLERLLYHACGDTEKVKGWMKELAETGKYTVDEETIANIRKDFVADWTNEEQCAEIIGRYNDEYGYFADTHTAVALYVAEKFEGERPMVVLSTASPYKFPRAVLAALGKDAPESDFDAIDMLEEYSGVTAPASLTELKGMDERFTGVITAQTIQKIAIE